MDFTPPIVLKAEQEIRKIRRNHNEKSIFRYFDSSVGIIA